MNKLQLIDKWEEEKSEWMTVWEDAIREGREPIIYRARVHVALINEFITDLKEASVQPELGRLS